MGRKKQESPDQLDLFAVDHIPGERPVERQETAHPPVPASPQFADALAALDHAIGWTLQNPLLCSRVSIRRQASVDAKAKPRGTARRGTAAQAVSLVHRVGG